MSDPGEVITAMLGKPVIVRLNSNLEYKGSLISLDGYMNVALEAAEEYLGSTFHRKFGDVFIRGNNVLYISPCH
jgi:U6 snRNA-associated Sm-like protein LSm6